MNRICSISSLSIFPSPFSIFNSYFSTLNSQFSLLNSQFSNYSISSFVSTKSAKRISTLLHTTESVEALPTSIEPPSTV